METRQKLQRLLGDKLQFEVPLFQHTTWKIGGQAKYFLVVDSSEELKKAVQSAVALGVPYFILGNGSNILVADSGFLGLVIKAHNNKIKVQKGKKEAKVYAEAGLPLGRLVGEMIGSDLCGLEWAVGIPGTVGGAIRGNAGAHGHEFSEVTETVEYLRQGKVKVLKNKDCKFSYRSSLFKQERGLVILSSYLKLVIGPQSQCLQTVKGFVGQRKGKHPNFPSTGCVFKNIIMTPELEVALQQKWPQFSQFVKGGKLPTAAVIDAAGLKGKQIGQAQVWTTHANHIINLGGATAEQVVQLITEVKLQVREKYNIVLQEEIEYVGF